MFKHFFVKFLVEMHGFEGTGTWFRTWGAGYIILRVRGTWFREYRVQVRSCPLPPAHSMSPTDRMTDRPTKSVIQSLHTPQPTALNDSSGLMTITIKSQINQC